VRGCLLLAFLCATSELTAQDPFEINVYEYEPMTLSEYSLEAHLNYEAQGNVQRDGTLLPTDHQTHLTMEPTFGHSPEFAVGFKFLSTFLAGCIGQYREPLVELLQLILVRVGEATIRAREPVVRQFDQALGPPIESNCVPLPADGLDTGKKLGVLSVFSFAAQTASAPRSSESSGARDRCLGP
jgi:hypothetical protein